ncbi:PAS domain S-box protein, partial [bacterium]|nr:PAS domain S-box protein [bacterium]
MSVPQDTLEQKCRYLSTKLEEAVAELVSGDLRNLILTREKHQAVAAFHFIRVMQERAEESFRVADLYRNVVRSITAEMGVDAAALFRVNHRERLIGVVACDNLRESPPEELPEELAESKALLVPMFANRSLQPDGFQKWVREVLTFPFFVWYPWRISEDETLFLFAGNQSEDFLSRRPFTQESLQIFGAIATVVQLHRENIDKTRELLRRKEGQIDFLADILRSAPFSVVATDGEGRIIYVNRAMEEMFGRSAMDLLGKDPMINTADPDPESLRQEILQTVQAGDVWRGVIPSRRKDGSLFDAGASVYRLEDRKGNPVAIVTFLEDISERKQAEEALRLSEKRYRRLFDSAADLIIVIDGKGELLDLNRRFIEESGYSRDEMLGRSIFTSGILTAKSVLLTTRHLASLLTGNEIPTFEVEGVRKDGVLIQYEVRAVRFETEKGQFAVQAILRNLTERREAAGVLARLATAVEQAAEAIVITDAGGKILYANPAFSRITGYDPQEALGQTPRILRSGRQTPGFYENLWQTIKSGQVWTGNFTNKRKDGTLYSEEATISPVRDGRGNIVNFVAVKRDITEEMRLEEQLRQAQKMEAVGQLAGGIAHDFNNLLQVIRGFSEMACGSLPEDHRGKKDLEQVMHAADRASDLVRQLLTFSRRDVSRPRPLDLNQITQDLSKMLLRLVGAHVELELRPEEELQAVLADPGQIEQILVNLALNARDAMPEGGRIVIETANITLDQAACEGHPWAKPGAFVTLVVADTGVGIPPDVQRRVFDPFFTTKEVGEGTGLGLSTVYGIVKQHQGLITFQSRPGQGSRFQICLPAADQP